MTKKALHEAALSKANAYGRKSKPKWFDRWSPSHPDLAREILELVETWQTDYELQKAYPTKQRLARFIADLPEVDVSYEIVRKQEFFKDDN